MLSIKKLAYSIWRKFPIRQLIKFIFVGCAATMVHFFCALYFSNYISIYLANGGGFVCALMVSYLGHSKLTFAVELEWLIFVRFFCVAASGLIISEIVLFWLSQASYFSIQWSLLFSVGIVPLVTFIVSRLWVFVPSAKASVINDCSSGHENSQ